MAYPFDILLVQGIFILKYFRLKKTASNIESIIFEAQNNLPVALNEQSLTVLN